MNPNSTYQLNLLSRYLVKKLVGLINKFMFVLLIPFLLFLLSISIAADGNQQKNQDSSKEYIFISDTQGMLNAEYLWNITNDNKAVRQLLFSDIIEHNPRSVFHMGDLVTKGYHNPSWNTIDIFLDSLSEKEIPFYPVMGNHELIFMPVRGEKNFQKRFPQHSRTGYSVRVDSLAVVLLNSNFGNMSDEEISKQNNWYNDELDELDRDSSIQIIVVGTHYSPYTNSTRVAPSENVQQYFVPGYLKSKKAKLFFTGHTHAFEHFILEGKDFFVIGGGGGPQQPLLVGNDARYLDNFNSEDKYRRFHYISLIKETDGYLLNVIMIDSTYSTLEEAYQLNLKN
jgi:hypothetical protein